MTFVISTPHSKNVLPKKKYQQHFNFHWKSENWQSVPSLSIYFLFKLRYFQVMIFFEKLSAQIFQPGIKTLVSKYEWIRHQSFRPSGIRPFCPKAFNWNRYLQEISVRILLNKQLDYSLSIKALFPLHFLFSQTSPCVTIPRNKHDTCFPILN